MRPSQYFHPAKRMSLRIGVPREALDAITHLRHPSACWTWSCSGDMVSACKGVVEHHGKRWGELSESEGNIVAMRVGVIAHEIIRTGRSAETEQTLH